MEETARQLTGLEDMARHMMNNASTPILPLKSSAFPLNNSLPKQANHISNGFIMPTCSVSHQGSSSTGDDVSQLMDTSSTPSHSDPSSFGQGNLSKDISKDKANLRSVSPSNSKALPPLMRGPLDLTAYQRVQDRNKLEGSLGVTVFERASRDTNKRIMILHKTGNVLLVDDNEASLRHPIPSLQPSLYNKNILDKKMTEYRSLADTPQQKEINLRECDLLPQLIPEKKVNSIIKASKCFPPQVVEGNLVVVQETHKSNLTEVVKKVFGDKKEPTEVFCGGKMIKMPDPSCSETGLDKPMSIDNIPECSTSRQTLNSYEIVDDLSAFAIVSPTSTLNSDVPSPYLPSKPSQLSLYNNSTNTLPLMVCQNLTVSVEVTTLPPNFAKQIMSGKTKRDGKAELVATHKESGRTGQVHEVRRDMKAEDGEYRRVKLLLSTPIMNFLNLKESTVANRKIEQSSVPKYNADPKAPIMLCNPHFSNGSNQEIGEDSENSDPLAEMISARQGRRQQRKIVPRYGEKGYIDPEDSSNLCKATLEHVRFASETDNARSAQSVSSVSVKSNEFDPQTKLAFNTVINKNESKAKILTAARNPPSNNKSGGSKGGESKNNSSSNKGQSSSKKGSGSSKQGVAAQFNSTPSRSPSPNKPQPSHKSDKECGDGKKSKKRAAQKKGESARHKDERNESEQPCPEPAPSSFLVKTANLRDNEPPVRPFQYISDFEESDEEVVSRSSISLSSSTDYSAPDTSADMTQKKKPRPPKSEVERLLDEPFYQEIAMLTAQTHLTDAAPCHATRSSYDTRNVSIVTRPQNNIRRGENRSNSRVTRSGNTMTNTGTTNTPQYGSRSGSGTSQRSNTATTRNESRSVSRISTNFSAPSSAHPDRLTRSSTRKATTVVVDETPRASRTTTTTSRQDSNASSHATVEASIVVTDDPTSSWRRSFRRRHNDPVSLKPVVESRRNEATGEAEEEDINVEIRMPEIVADAPVNSTTSISPDHSSVNLTKQKTSVPNISPARSESGVPPAPDQMLTKIPVRTRFCYRNSSILAGLTRSPPRDMSLLGSPFTFGNRAVISKTEKAKFQRGLSKRFCLLFKPQSPERFTNSSVFNFVNQNFTELNTSSAPVLVDNAATVNSADKRLNESATNQATPRSNLEKPKKRTTQRSNEKYSGTSKKRKTADEKASPKVVRHQEVHIPESVNTQQMYVPDHEIVREALVPEPELIQEAYVSEPKRIQQVQTPDLIPSGSGIVTRSVVKRQQDPNHTRQLYADEYSETEPSPANLVVSESNVNEEDIIHMSLDQVRASEHKKSGLDKDSNLPSRPPSDRGNSNASTHNKSFIKKHKTFRNSNPRSERHDEDDTTIHESPPPPASTLVCNSNGVSQNRNIPHPVLIENKIADPPSNAQYRLPPNSRRNSVGYGANSLNGLRQRHAHRPDPRLTQSARSRVHSVGRESSGNLADLRRKRLFYHFFKNSNHPDIVERPDPRVLPSQSIPNVPVIYFTIPSLAISDSSSQVDLLSSSQFGTKTSSQYSGPRCGLSHLNRTSRISNFHSEVPNLYQPIQSLNYRNTSPEFPVRSRICRQAPVNPARSRRYLNKLAKEADARKAQTIITTEVENVALASTMNDRNRGDSEFGDHSSVDVEDEEMDVWEAAQVAVSPAMPSFVNRQFLHEHLIITDAEYGVGNGFEQEQQIVSEDEPQIVAQVAPQIGLEDESQIVSENEPQIVSEDEPRIVSEDEPRIVSEDEPQIVSEDEPRIVSEDEPRIVSEDEPQIVSEDESEPVSENEPDLVSENEPELVNEDELIIPLPLTHQITSRRKDSENTDVSDHLLHEKRLERTNDERRVAQMCNQNDQLLQEINNQPIGENRLNAEQQNAIDEEEREIAEEEYRADLLSRMDRFDNIITSTGQVLHVPYNPKRNRHAMMQRIVPAYRSDFPVDLADGMELEWLPMNEASTSHAFPRFSLSYILRPTNYNPDRRRTNSATPLQHVYRSRRTRNRSVSQNRVTPFIHDTRDRRLFDERRMREVPAQRRFTDGVQEESIAQNLTRYDDVTLSLLCQEEFESNNQEEFESNNQEEFESNNQGELRLVYNVDSYGNRPSSTHTESVIESHSPVIQNYSPVLSIEEHNLEMEAVSSNQETDIPPTQARDAEVTDDLEIENISANEGVQQDDVVIEEIYQDENAATVEDAHAPNQEDIIGDQESAQQIETLQPVDVIIPSIETEPELHANRLELDAAEFIPDADQIIHEQIPLIVVTEQTAPIVMPDNELEEFFLSGGSQGLTTPSVENVIQMESDPVVEAFVPEPSPFDPYETSSDDQLDVMDRLLEEIRIPANSDCETVAVPSADQNCDCQPELNGQDNLVYNDQLEAAYGEFSSGILNVETDQENEYPAITSSDRETSPEEQSILAPPTSVASSTPSSQKNVVLPQVISVSVSDQSNPHHQNNSVMMEARIGEVLNRIVNDPVFSQQLDPHAAHSSDLVRSFRATEQSNRLTGSEELCERILKSIGHLPVATIYSTQDSAAPPMSMEEVTDYSNPLGDGVSNRDENSVSNRGENSVGMTSGSSIANRDHVKKHENDNLINGDVIQEIGSHDFTLLTLNGQRSEVRDRQQLRYDIIRQEERDSIKAYELRIMEKAEHERHLRNEEEAKNNEIKRIEEEEKKKLEELARLKAEEGARLKAEEEARLKAEEEARLEAEEEARLKAEEEARLKAELQAKIQEELEADYLEHQAIEIQELRAYQIENDAHSLAYFNYVTHNTVIAEREFTHYYTERYNQLWNESMIENARISEEWYAEVDEEIRVEAERIRLEEEAKMEAERIHLEEKAKIETERIRLAEIARLKEEASLRTKAMVSTIRAARKAALRKAKLLAEKLRLDEAEKARLLAEKLKVEEAKKARLLAKKLKVEEAEKTAILIKKLKLEEAEKASIGAPKLRFEEAEKAKILAEQAEEEKSSILAAAEKIIFEEAEKVRILAEAKNAKIEEAKAQRIRVEEAEKARILAEKAYAEGIRFAEVEAEKARIAEAEADAEKARIAEARMIQETDNARKIAEEDILKRIKAKTFENYKELLAEERTLNSLDKEDTRSSPKFPKTLQNEQSSSQNLPNSGAAGFDFTSFANGSASNLRLEFYTENAHVGIVNNHAPVLLSVQSTTSKNSSKEDSPQNNSTTNESNVSSDRNTEVPAGCSMTRTLVGVGFNASSDLLKDSPRTVGLILTADGNDYVAIVSPSANDAEVNHAQTSAHEVDDRTNDVAMMLLSFSGQTPFNNGQVPNKKVLNQSNKVTAPAEVKESDIVEDIPEDDPEEDHHVEVIDKVSVNESKEDYRLRVIEPVSENEPEEDDPVKFIEPVSGDIDAIEELSQDSDVEADSLNADSDEGEYHSGVEDAFKEIDQNIRLDNTKCKSISLPDDNGDDDGDDEESHNESGDEHFDDENKRQGIALSNNNGEAEYAEPTNLVESEYIRSVENGSAILLETEPANSSDGEYNSDEEQSVPVITITKPQNESERNPSTDEVYSEDNTPTIMDGAEEIPLDSSIESTAVNHRIDVPHLNVMVSSPPTSFQHSMAETYVDLNKTATPSPIHLNRVLHTSIISSPAIENGSLNDDDNHTTLRNAQSVIIINAFQFNSLRSFETIDNNNPNNFSKGNNIVDESSDLKISGLESKRVLFDQYSRTIQEATRTPDASASPEMEILEEMGQLLDNDENEAQFSSYSSGGNESYDDMPTLVNSSKSPIDGHPMSGEETDRAMILAYSDRNHQITTQVNGEKVHKNKKKKYRKYIEPQDNSPHSQNLHRQIPKIKIRIVTSSCAEDDAVSVENGQISNQEAAFDENVLVVNGDACVKKIYESSIKELTAITDGLRNIRHIHIPVGATHRSLSFSDLQSLKTSAEENFLMANQMDEDNEDVPGPSKKRALNIGSDDEDTPVPRKKRAPRIASDDEEEVIRERISKPVSKKMNKIKNCKGRNNRSSSSQAAISSAIVPRRNKASDEERLPALNHISGGIPPPKDGFVMYGIYKVKVPEHYVPPAAYHGRPILQTCPKINFNAAALRKSLPKTSDIFPKTRKKIRGIKNTGNICYINSVIQCLVNLVDFKQQILKYRGVMIPKELEFELTIQFVEIMYELDLDNQSVSTKALNIEKFVTLVIKMRPKTFLKGIEGDSIEFLDFLLDNIEHQIDNYIAITGSTLVNPISLFRAQIIREEVCERCFSSEYHVDYVNALSLNAPEETGRGLVCDLLENWLFEKFKFTLERSSCAVCNHTHKFQRHHLYKLPQILILNVQRTFYHQITNNYRKSAVEAKCDVMNFYIALFLHINSPDFYYNTVFRLNSAIEHSGRTATSGHYSSLIRKNVEDWFKCDDNQISTARQPTVSQASIYFFELYNCTAEQSNEAIYHKIKKYPTMKRQILAAFGFTTPEQVRQMTENGEAMFSSRKIFDRQFISRNNLIFSN